MIEDNQLATSKLGGLSGEACVLSVPADFSPSAFNQVFQGEISGALSAADLSVRHATAEEFRELLSEDGQGLEKNVLYVVNSDSIDAHNTCVLNVAAPALSSVSADIEVSGKCAANLNWVKEYVDLRLAPLCSLIGELNQTIDNIVDGQGAAAEEA